MLIARITSIDDLKKHWASKAQLGTMVHYIQNHVVSILALFKKDNLQVQSLRVLQFWNENRYF